MTDRKPMAKPQVIAHFATTFGMPRAMVRDFFAELAELSLKETLETGSFTLPGVVKLSRTERNARRGRNPRTGEAVDIPAKTAVKMRLSKSFKDGVAAANANK